MTEPVLKLEGITKRFGTLLANDAISLQLAKGEVLALLGENGAGKTTLMNILFGHYRADAGRVFAFGRELPPGQPSAAIEAGIGMVHQHFALAPNLSVLENILAGAEPMWRLRSDRTSTRDKLRALSQKFGLAVDPDAIVGDLSVGERQRVEILKPLYRDARILILDEPTAVLTETEARASLRHASPDGGRRAVAHLHLPQAARGVAAARTVSSCCARARSSRNAILTTRPWIAWPS